jgi:hypothetical protein
MAIIGRRPEVVTLLAYDLKFDVAALQVACHLGVQVFGGGGRYGRDVMECAGKFGVARHCLWTQELLTVQSYHRDPEIALVGLGAQKLYFRGSK